MPNAERLVDALNKLWTAERALIDQYVARSKVSAAWGEEEISAQFHEFAFTEMREVSEILDRIVALGGIPALQQVDPVRVGTSIAEQIALSIEGEIATIACLEATLVICREEGDETTTALVSADLEREREHLEWLDELARRRSVSASQS